MKNNYLSEETEENIKKYDKKDSYFSVDMFANVENKYLSLPDEYAVFSEIDGSWFERTETTQFKLISNCLNYIREQLTKLYLLQGVVCILPKLKALEESDGTIVFNWAYANFRIFFSFENDANGNDAYYGMIVQEGEDSIVSQTNRINFQNYKINIDKVLQQVINIL